MPAILWTGKIAFFKRMLLNINGIIAWASGNIKDTDTMKEEIKTAYNGDRTGDVVNYDLYGQAHYDLVASTLLEKINVHEKLVLDVGCGTGISTFKLLERQARKVYAVDLSEYMIDVLKAKLEERGYTQHLAEASVADAENLPFEDGVFDVVVSSMVFGMVPNQEKMLREMARVAKPSGVVALSTHGPLHYAELSDAVFGAIPKRYMLGKRILYWPRGSDEMQTFFETAGLCEIKVEQSIWQDDFQNSDDMYEFIASSTANFYASFVPDKVIEPLLKAIRKYFVDRKISKITLDVIYAYGMKAKV